MSPPPDPPVLRPWVRQRDDKYGTAMRLVVEGDELVGYGWGGRRYAVRTADIAWLERYGTQGQNCWARSPSKPVLAGIGVIGHHEELLLRVDGWWAVADVRAFGAACGLRTMVDKSPAVWTSVLLRRRRAAGCRRLRLTNDATELGQTMPHVGALTLMVLSIPAFATRSYLLAAALLVAGAAIAAVTAALTVVSNRGNWQRAELVPRLAHDQLFDEEVKRARAQAARTGAQLRRAPAPEPLPEAATDIRADIRAGMVLRASGYRRWRRRRLLLGLARVVAARRDRQP